MEVEIGKAAWPPIAPVSLLLILLFLLFFDLFNLAFCFAFLEVNGKHSHDIDPILFKKKIIFKKFYSLEKKYQINNNKI